MLSTQQSAIDTQQSVLQGLARHISAAVAAAPAFNSVSAAALPALPGVAADGTSITVSAGTGGSVSLAGECGAVNPCDLYQDVEGLKAAIAVLTSDD